MTPLTRSKGYAVGARSAWIPGLQSTLSLYVLDFDSELVFAGDSGTTEAGRPSRRTGFEFTNFYKPKDWLTIDAQGVLYWNGEVVGKSEMQRRLRAAATLKPQPELHLRADKTTSYQALAEVMAEAAQAGLMQISSRNIVDAVKRYSMFCICSRI